MKKVFHLSSCNTCVRIIKELGGLTDFEHQNLKEQNISILEEYTFLKRPVIVDGDTVFVGNAKKVVAAAKEHLGV